MHYSSDKPHCSLQQVNHDGHIYCVAHPITSADASIVLKPSSCRPASSLLLLIAMPWPARPQPPQLMKRGGNAAGYCPKPNFRRVSCSANLHITQGMNSTVPTPVMMCSSRRDILNTSELIIGLPDYTIPHRMCACSRQQIFGIFPCPVCSTLHTVCGSRSSVSAGRFLLLWLDVDNNTSLPSIATALRQHNGRGE